MSLRSALQRVAAHEDINFLLTNRIPRLALTRFMGWFSRIEHPVVRHVSIALWRLFCDVDLTDAAESRFRSLHHAFVRPLRPGAREVAPEPHLITAPSDGIVGAFGTIREGQAYQIKGFPYSIADLLGDEAAAAEFEDGCYVTLRLTAGMYHRFHAPHDIAVEQVRYIAGDTWNVNPIALKRVEGLFCKNERAAITARLSGSGRRIVLVPVAAVLVASIRLPFIDPERNLRAQRREVIGCDAPFSKGDEMGWFEHGSTIVLLAPKGFAPVAALFSGAILRMGAPLLTAEQAG